MGRIRRYTLTALAVTVSNMSLIAGASAQSGPNGFDISNALVDSSLIVSGGPPRDGIPALTTPDVVSAAEADFVTDDDRVLGVVVAGAARAYPIKILNYHEIVNDAIGGEQFVVTFCPLCGTGIAFDANVEGERLTFGVSGLLYSSDVLMYDRESDSLWSQILAQAVTGPKAGQELVMRPVTHTTWAQWREAHPTTEVLSIDTGHPRQYYRDPYRGYADSSRVWFPVGNRDPRLEAKAVVVGVNIGETFKAYPFDALPRDRREIDDQVGGETVTIRFDVEAASAEVLNAAGEVVPTFTAFWFAWSAFHPNTLIYTR